MQTDLEIREPEIVSLEAAWRFLELAVKTVFPHSHEFLISLSALALLSSLIIFLSFP